MKSQASYAVNGFRVNNVRRFAAGDLLKRGSDFTMALVSSLVFFVPCLVIGFFIWADDRHSPVFRQERIGRKGRPFTIYKFRSMRIDAEKGGTPALCADHDARLTKVGRFIRAHHLDELPQLWNVLRGDMSFVGYRPERMFYIEQIMAHNPRYSELFAIRPGLFSEATLYNGYTDTMEKMLRRLDMDLSYLDRRSFRLDMTIIIKTALSILTGKKF